MRLHDEIYHYGVKGMKWHKKKASTTVTTEYETDPETGEVIITKVGGGVPLSITENMDWDKYSVKNGELVKKSAFETGLIKLSRKLNKNSINKYKMSFETGIAKLLNKSDPNKKYTKPKRNLRED
jgi:hypothetical protein